MLNWFAFGFFVAPLAHRKMATARVFAVVAVLVLSTPGNAKLAKPSSPPMGWRSWNAFLLDVSQERIISVIDAMVQAPSAQAVAGIPPGLRPKGPAPSLKDLGYLHCGIDDGYQDCGAGVNGTFHDADGWPLINKTKFPDMLVMNSYAHQLGILMGFYANNCWCNEGKHTTGKGHPVQDVEALLVYEFDGIKIDSCGPAKDINVWSRLIENASSTILVENCGDSPLENKKNASPATIDADGCDYDLFRISPDVAPNFLSTMWNLNHMIPFFEANTIQKGCWAYPDMLQVGRLETVVESRTHFAGWAVTSSPLILGFDLTDPAVYDAMYPVVSNPLVLSVNQEFVGTAGALVRNASTTFAAQVPHGAANNECKGKRCTAWDAPTWQLWRKPLRNNRAALLAVNVGDKPLPAGSITISKADFGLPAHDAKHLLITDAFTGVNTTIPMPSATTSYQVPALAPHDSHFIIAAVEE
eukprot:m.230243 g.230243  ORF g.230243 m.230243 type:complete len:471 (+) comp18858_c1_seq2:4808-6220(+)